MPCRRLPGILLTLVLPACAAPAQGGSLVEDGRQEIQSGLRAARPTWPVSALLGLPAVWGMPMEPTGRPFRDELQRRYGLTFDPQAPNDGLPAGLTATTAQVYSGGRYQPGFTVSCQACHCSSIMGAFREGISNAFFDYQRLNQDLQAASGGAAGAFFEANPARNSLASYSNYMGRLGVFVRQPFPALDLTRLYAVFADPNPDNATVQVLKPERPYRELVKPQPWVGYRYKVRSGSGLYVDGGYLGSPAAAHYALHFTLDPTGLDFLAAVQRFDRVGPAYLSSLTAPAYPWLDELDQRKVARGLSVYTQACAACHGSFALDAVTSRYALVSYPGALVDRSVVQTDTLRIDYRIDYDAEIPDYVKSLYHKTGKYLAPPLVGLWARAPYFHNASIPTLAQVLDSGKRMRRYAIQPLPDAPASYDRLNVGWMATDLSSFDGPALAALSQRDPYVRIYDPTDKLGMSNAGHTFGDAVTSDERQDLLEFLKAL